MMFNQPNAKKNPRLPWERKKVTLFDRLEVLVKRKKKAPTKMQIALAMIQGVRNHNRKARKNDGR